MSTSTPPTQAQPQGAPAPSHKNFQELAVEAIIAGDRAAFHKLYVGKTDINRRLVPYKDIEYKPKYNPNERYIKIRGPTMTMLAVLCEQDEILQYILENKGPDLSVRVSGYTAVHLAAMVKDYRPLQLLIQYEWVQENIDMPIELKGVQSESTDFTTALHAAVSNRRIPQIFLLISDFPPYKRLPAAKPQHAPSGKADEGSGAPPEDETHTVYNPANVDQRSAVGSPALYIATFMKEPAMVEILRAAGADPTRANAKGETSIQLAERYRRDAEEKARGKPTPRPGPADRLIPLLTKDVEDGLDVLRQRYAPELVPKTVIGAGEEDEEAAAAGAVQEEGGADAKKKKGKGNERQLQQILEAIRELSARVGRLEVGGGPGIVRVAGPDVRAAPAPVCGRCGASPAHPCDTCHRAFCAPCGVKGDIHTGCVE
jgi:ankyrin repeat protein